MGFWAGPHAQELYADYSFSLGGNHFEIMVSDAKRGELTIEMLEDQYCRPQNCDEENNTYGSMEHSETLLDMCVKLDQKIAKLACA